MILGIAFQLLAQYKKYREAQAALRVTTGNVDDPTTPEREDLLSDAEIIALLGSDSAAVAAKASELIAKYSSV